MRRAGTPLHTVQAVSGWKRPDVLLRHYTQASLEDKRKAAEVLARVAAAPAEKERPADQDGAGAAQG